MTETFRSRKGRKLVVLGDPALLTMERLGEFSSRADTDRRIASLSLVAGSAKGGQWLRSTAPAGVLIAIATDETDLVGREIGPRKPPQRGGLAAPVFSAARDVKRPGEALLRGGQVGRLEG